MDMKSRLFPRLGRFTREEEGAATIEFVILFPMLMAILLSIFEAGWLMTRHMMIERGVDIAARDVRLGNANALTHDGLRDTICAAAEVLTNCTSILMVDVVPMDLSASYPQDQPNCLDRTGAIDPVLDYSPGERGQIMFIRACMVVDPVFPGIGLGLQLPKDASGGYQMVAYSAFINEPI